MHKSVKHLNHSSHKSCRKEKVKYGCQECRWDQTEALLQLMKGLRDSFTVEEEQSSTLTAAGDLCFIEKELRCGRGEEFV